MLGSDGLFDSNKVSIFSTLLMLLNRKPSKIAVIKENNAISIDFIIDLFIIPMDNPTIHLLNFRKIWSFY